MKTDYSQYQFSLKEWMLYGAEAIVIVMGIDYLFYKSIWALLLILPFFPVWMLYKNKQCRRARQKEMNYQFKEALTSLRINLQAGYSVENAVIATTRDLEKLYRKDSYILREFHYIESQLKVSVPIEELLLDFGNRSYVEDISNFATVFATAKRSGGDLGKIMQKTAKILGDKIEVKKEIDATIAGKKAEQTLMSAMPFAIIVYMQVTSPGFLGILYGNTFGIMVMTLCLGLYIAAFWMGKRIVDIEV